jgi:hypothetical protein
MYIVSKFRDYYDTASAYGIDKDCVYNRELKEIELKTSKLPYGSDQRLRDKSIFIEPFLIGFCGKIYPAVKLSCSTSSFNYSAPTQIEEMLFSFTEFQSRLESLGIYLEKSKQYFWQTDRIIHKTGAENFFYGDHREYENLFREYHTPIFSIGKPGLLVRENVHLTINPSLRKLQFMKMKDPHTTFQDIYQYLAGVLGNKEKDIVQISDKDMLKQKGFDKYSFKTMKGEKKPRAKNRGKDE